VAVALLHNNSHLSTHTGTCTHATRTLDTSRGGSLHVGQIVTSHRKRATSGVPISLVRGWVLRQWPLRLPFLLVVSACSPYWHCNCCRCHNLFPILCWCTPPPRRNPTSAMNAFPIAHGPYCYGPSHSNADLPSGLTWQEDVHWTLSLTMKPLLSPSLHPSYADPT